MFLVMATQQRYMKYTFKAGMEKPVIFLKNIKTNTNSAFILNRPLS